MMPFSPPRKITAPTMLVRKKAKATGRPSSIARQTRPSIRARAAGQAIRSTPASVMSYVSRTTPCTRRKRSTNSMASSSALTGMARNSSHSGTYQVL